MRRGMAGAAAFFTILLTISLPVSAEKNSNSTYAPYTYTYEEEYTAIPEAYRYEGTITAADCGAGTFSDLNDIVCAADGTVCLSDSGNDRVVLLSGEGQYQGEIAAFAQNGEEDALENPTGLFVSGDDLYIADSGNSRILQFRLSDRSFVREFSRPVISLLDEDYLYEPTRFVVTKAGKLYVIAKNINQGLIELNENGEFVSFIGAPRVSADLIDLLWRKLMNKTQREATVQNVPTEYSAVTLDQSGFFYVTSRSTNVSPIGRLNTQGVDVLKQSNFSKSGAIGDMLYTDKKGNAVSSNFVDVLVKENGVYFALDAANGRVFCYSNEGDLLYVFGSSGSLSGLFQSAVSMELVGDEIYVVDQRKNHIHVFSQTAFGAAIESAVQLQKEGEYTRAVEMWSEVLRRCSHYTQAQLSIARIQIYQGNYDEAMTQLKNIGEKTYYSKAFHQKRDQFISDNFLWLLLGGAVAIVGLVLLLKTVKRFRRRETALAKQLRYGRHVVFHPLEGYWDLKNERLGSVPSALILDGIALGIYLLNTQFGGYLFTENGVWDSNLLLILAKVVLPFALWCVASWCFTTLMDGKGSMKDIFIATSYALYPYVLLGVPLFILSHVLSYEEQNFYYVLAGIIAVWMLLLLFSSLMMTHDYSLSKAVLTAVLTIVGMLLILFIALLFVYLLQESVGFLMQLYEECMFRLSY